MKKFRVNSAMRCTANDRMARCQVYAIEEGVITNRPDDDSPFTYHAAIDPHEIDAFWARRT